MTALERDTLSSTHGGGKPGTLEEIRRDERQPRESEGIKMHVVKDMDEGQEDLRIKVASGRIAR